MIYNRFYFNLLVRLCVLLLTCLLFAFVIMTFNRFFTPVFIGLLIIIQFFFLLKYVNKTNRELAKFLLYLKEKDTSIVFEENKIESTFGSLHTSFAKIKEDFAHIKHQEEAYHILLQNVIDHIATVFFVLENSEKIIIKNNAANLLFTKNNIIEFLDLRAIHPNLPSFIMNLKNTQQQIFKYDNTNDEPVSLMITVSMFNLGERKLSLISFQNIEFEMENMEVESWHKLTRVLAHEISNSVNPITMLVSSIGKKASNLLALDENRTEEEKKQIHDIIRSSDIIETRGNGLIDFINAYKSYTKLPNPDQKKLKILPFLQNIREIFDEQLKQKDIELSIEIQESLDDVYFDPKQIEQVLINLIKNAIFALKDVKNPVIEICVFADLQHFNIEVIDNGGGVAEEITEKIFIPFYTTKEGGSGIGLSLSKNIMHMHKGQIFLHVLHGKTIFRLKFNQAELN